MNLMSEDLEKGCKQQQLQKTLQVGWQEDQELGKKNKKKHNQKHLECVPSFQGD